MRSRTARTTDDELFEIFSEAIKASHDPHVSLRAGGRWIGGAKPDTLALHNQKEFASEKPEDRFLKSLEKLRSVMKDDFLNVDCRMAGNDFIVWGRSNQISAISIFSSWEITLGLGPRGKIAELS